MHLPSKGLLKSIEQQCDTVKKLFNVLKIIFMLLFKYHLKQNVYLTFNT